MKVDERGRRDILVTNVPHADVEAFTRAARALDMSRAGLLRKLMRQVASASAGAVAGSAPRP
jgi:hypothetical protein